MVHRCTYNSNIYAHKYIICNELWGGQLQLISEQYMVKLHLLPGRYTIFWYLADYVNTLSPI